MDSFLTFVYYAQARDAPLRQLARAMSRAAAQMPPSLPAPPAAARTATGDTWERTHWCDQVSAAADLPALRSLLGDLGRAARVFATTADAKRAEIRGSPARPRADGDAEVAEGPAAGDGGWWARLEASCTAAQVA